MNDKDIKDINDANLCKVVAVVARELGELTEKMRALKQVSQNEFYSTLPATLFETIQEMSPEQLATCLVESVALRVAKAMDLSGIKKDMH